MARVIPYFQVPVYQLGPIPLDPWGTLVCIGFVLGLEIARARGIEKGLDVRDIVDGIVATVLMGFVGGHMVHVFAYHPGQLQAGIVEKALIAATGGEPLPLTALYSQPLRELGVLAVVRIWAGFSSFGGFIGAVLGSVIFFRWIRPRSWWEHADAIIYAFPFAWIFGRLGCFLSHDHIGRPTDFPLAVNYPTGGPRFDLGLNEALLAMVIAAVFRFTGKKERPPGFFLMLWCLMYAPVRFLLDFLRAQPGDSFVSAPDVRWAGLTPAQWGCVVMLAGGLAILGRQLRAPAPHPAGPPTTPPG